jgi:hypothetical protein
MTRAVTGYFVEEDAAGCQRNGTRAVFEDGTLAAGMTIYEERGESPGVYSSVIMGRHKRLAAMPLFDEAEGTVPLQRAVSYLV